MDNKKGKRQSASIFGGMGFYIALLVCVVAAGVVGYFALDHSLKNSAPPLEEAPDPVTAPVDRAEVPPAAPVIRNETAAIPVPPPPVREKAPERPQPQEKPPARETSAPAAVPQEPEAPEEDLPTMEPVEFQSPLTGETVAVFSMEALCYDPTLADWRTHEGMDIRAESGAPVVAAAPGVVLSAEEDSLLGTTVRVDHGDGYVTTYASLMPELPVAAGDAVSAGDPVGLVGSTALSEAALGPHLHFAVEKDGEPVDPEEFLGRAPDE